jgi:hypothetical protein
MDLMYAREHVAKEAKSRPAEVVDLAAALEAGRR